MQLRRHRRPAQVGAAAIELAVVIGATMVLLPSVVLFAKVFYQYSVMKDATRDAAMFMASASPAAIRDDAERGRLIAVAQRMVSDAALGAGMVDETTVGEALVTCGGNPCLDLVPANFDVAVTFSIDGEMFNYYTGQWTDQARHVWQISARSTVPVSK